MIKKDELIKKITDELDISDISKEMRDKIITKLGENILKKLTIQVFDEIPKEEHAELKTILESGNMDNAYKFLNDKISNFDDFVSKSAKSTIDEFKKRANIA